MNMTCVSYSIVCFTNKRVYDTCTHLLAIIITWIQWLWYVKSLPFYSFGKVDQKVLQAHKWGTEIVGHANKQGYCTFCENTKLVKSTAYGPWGIMIRELSLLNRKWYMGVELYIRFDIEQPGNVKVKVTQILSGMRSVRFTYIYH